MNIEQITILTTNRCTAECKHCLMDSSPARKEKLSYRRIKYTISKILSYSSDLKVVIFSGGEATLLKEDLLNSIAFCAENNLISRLVTNCWWAKTKSSAKNYIQRLRASGLNEINFSIDDYHLPYVDLTYVRNAWQACKNEGFTSVVLANCHGPMTRINSQFIQNFFGENIQLYWNQNGTINNNLNCDADGTLYIISNARLQKLGRAKSLPPEKITYPDNNYFLYQTCPWAINSAALSPTGNLLACCGIEVSEDSYLNFGKIENIDIKKSIFKNQSQEKIINLLRNKGPYELILLLEKEMHFGKNNKKYSSMCEICDDLMHHDKLSDLLSQINL